MLKIAKNSSIFDGFFDGFSAVLSIFATPTIEWTSKIYSKNHKKIVKAHSVLCKAQKMSFLAQY